MRGKISKLWLVASSISLAMPAVAHATTYNGRVTALRFGESPKRVSVQVTASHSGCGSGAANFYTFTGKDYWKDAFLEAIENDLEVSITGKDVCTLGVEEIRFFDINNASGALRRK